MARVAAASPGMPSSSPLAWVTSFTTRLPGRGSRSPAASPGLDGGDTSSGGDAETPGLDGDMSPPPGDDTGGPASPGEPVEPAKPRRPVRAPPLTEGGVHAVVDRMEAERAQRAEEARVAKLVAQGVLNADGSSKTPVPGGLTPASGKSTPNLFESMSALVRTPGSDWMARLGVSVRNLSGSRGVEGQTPAPGTVTVTPNGEHLESPKVTLGSMLLKIGTPTGLPGDEEGAEPPARVSSSDDGPDSEDERAARDLAEMMTMKGSLHALRRTATANLARLPGLHRLRRHGTSGGDTVETDDDDTGEDSERGATRLRRHASSNDSAAPSGNTERRQGGSGRRRKPRTLVEHKPQGSGDGSAGSAASTMDVRRPVPRKVTDATDASAVGAEDFGGAEERKGGDDGRARAGSAVGAANSVASEDLDDDAESTLTDALGRRARSGSDASGASRSSAFSGPSMATIGGVGSGASESAFAATDKSESQLARGASMSSVDTSGSAFASGTSATHFDSALVPGHIASVDTRDMSPMSRGLTSATSEDGTPAARFKERNKALRRLRSAESKARSSTSRDGTPRKLQRKGTPRRLRSADSSDALTRSNASATSDDETPARRRRKFSSASSVGSHISSVAKRLRGSVRRRSSRVSSIASLTRSRSDSTSSGSVGGRNGMRRASYQSWSGSSIDGNERGEGTWDHTVVGGGYHLVRGCLNCFSDVFCKRDLRVLELRRRYHRTFVVLELSLKEVNRLYKAYSQLGVLTPEGRLPIKNFTAEVDIDRSPFFKRLVNMIVFTRANSCNNRFLDFRSWVLLVWMLATLRRDDLVGFLFSLYATCFRARSPREDRRDRLPRSILEWDRSNLEKARHCVAVENEQVLLPVSMVRRILLEVNGEKPGDVTGTMLSTQSHALLYGNAEAAKVVTEDDRLPQRMRASRRQIVPAEHQFTVDFSKKTLISQHAPDIANLLSKEGDVSVRTLDAFIRSRPSLLYPLFGMNRQITHHIIGASFWGRLTKRRQRSRNRLLLPTALADLLEKLARIDMADAADVDDNGDGYSSAGSASGGEQRAGLLKPGKRALRKVGALDKKKYHKTAKKASAPYQASMEDVLHAERQNYERRLERDQLKQGREHKRTERIKRDEVLQAVNMRSQVMIQESSEAPILVRKARDKYTSKTKLRSTLTNLVEGAKWQQVADEDGNPYFYHVDTHEVAWELPPGEALVPSDSFLGMEGLVDTIVEEDPDDEHAKHADEGDAGGAGASFAARKRSSVSSMGSRGAPERRGVSFSVAPPSKSDAATPRAPTKARKRSSVSSMTSDIGSVGKHTSGSSVASEGNAERFMRHPSYADDTGINPDFLDLPPPPAGPPPASAYPHGLRLPPLAVRALGEVPAAEMEMRAEGVPPAVGPTPLGSPTPPRATMTPQPFKGNSVPSTMLRDLKQRLSPRSRAGKNLKGKLAMYTPQDRKLSKMAMKFKQRTAAVKAVTQALEAIELAKGDE